MAWLPIPNNPNWEYDDNPPDPGGLATTLWATSVGGVRVAPSGEEVYVNCRHKILHPAQTSVPSEISKTFWDGKSPRFQGLLDLYGGASAAYSLRALSTGWLAGDVVEVRRSSDSTTQDFTASQITSGAMLDFVNNGTTDLYNSARYFNGTSTNVALGSTVVLSGAFSISFNICIDRDGVTAGNYACSLGDFNSKSKIEFRSFDKKIVIKINNVDYVIGSYSSRVQYAITIERNASNQVRATVNGIVGSWVAVSASDFKVKNIGSYDGTTRGFIGGIIYNININDQAACTGLGTSVTAWEDTIGSNDGTESNGAAYTGQGYDGFVSTWYDQSGNANDATQATTTAQPKIVDDGALVTGGLDFDGVDDYLISDGLLNQLDNSDFLITSVVNSAFAMGGLAGIPRFYIWDRGFSYDTNETITWTQPLVATINTYQCVGASQEVFVSGESVGTATQSQVGLFDSDFYIGRTTTLYRNGPFNELIVYASDQSANRVGIETNINNAYSIYS